VTIYHKKSRYSSTFGNKESDIMEWQKTFFAG